MSARICKYPCKRFNILFAAFENSFSYDCCFHLQTFQIRLVKVDFQQILQNTGKSQSRACVYVYICVCVCVCLFTYSK